MMAVRGVKSARHMAAVQDGRIPPKGTQLAYCGPVPATFY